MALVRDGTEIEIDIDTHSLTPIGGDFAPVFRRSSMSWRARAVRRPDRCITCAEVDKESGVVLTGIFPEEISLPGLIGSHLDKTAEPPRVPERSKVVVTFDSTPLHCTT